MNQNNFKYIYTKKEGWIDTHHFIASAYYSNKYGYKLSMFGGIMVEWRQGLSGYRRLFGFRAEKGTYSSSWTKEDIPSDYMGAAFGVLPWLNKSKSLADELEIFFKQMEPADPKSNMSEYKCLPKNEEEWEAKANPPGYLERFWSWLTS